jgi:hypothetical protein
MLLDREPSDKSLGYHHGVPPGRSFFWDIRSFRISRISKPLGRRPRIPHQVRQIYRRELARNRLRERRAHHGDSRGMTGGLVVL